MKKILIVEDDLSVSELVKDILEDDGYTVIAIASAEKAAHIIDTEKPDLAMIDMVLPGQGGMDLILDLHESNPTLGIILTSGKIDMNKSTFKALAHQFGVIGILPKPFTIEELLSTVRNALDATVPTSK